jgi:uncharacterized membrane protein YfcA
MMGLGEANAVVLAVGTARASILVASLTAALAHWRAGTIDGSAVALLLPDQTDNTAGRTVDALGDVALFCGAALWLLALFVAPIAARWSARAVSVLRRLFALCLAAIALRLLLRNGIGAWVKRRNCVYLVLVPVRGFGPNMTSKTARSGRRR